MYHADTDCIMEIQKKHDFWAHIKFNHNYNTSLKML